MSVWLDIQVQKNKFFTMKSKTIIVAMLLRCFSLAGYFKISFVKGVSDDATARYRNHKNYVKRIFFEGRVVRREMCDTIYKAANSNTLVLNSGEVLLVSGKENKWLP